MKLLFDQNISHKLVLSLSKLYTEVCHVRDLHLQFSDDQTVWNYAKDNNFVIVTKDSDFHQRSFLHGFPPKIIWIRKGNCTSQEIENILKDQQTAVRNFYSDEKASYLILV